LKYTIDIAILKIPSFNLWILPSVEFTCFQVKNMFRWNLHVLNPTLKSTTCKSVEFTIAQILCYIPNIMSTIGISGRMVCRENRILIIKLEFNYYYCFFLIIAYICTLVFIISHLANELIVWTLYTEYQDLSHFVTLLRIRRLNVTEKPKYTTN